MAKQTSWLNHLWGTGGVCVRCRLSRDQVAHRNRTISVKGCYPGVASNVWGLARVRGAPPPPASRPGVVRKGI